MEIMHAMDWNDLECMSDGLNLTHAHTEFYHIRWQPRIVGAWQWTSVISKTMKELPPPPQPNVPETQTDLG